MAKTARQTPRIFTIGVYGADEAGFFGALRKAGVDLFCDIRLRRGIRGSKYSFANGSYLQSKLKEMGIRYVHAKHLAPLKETRALQKTADEAVGTQKTDRLELSDAFVQSYERECMADFDARDFLENVAAGSKAIVLFCVEREPEACHRSIVASRLAKAAGASVEDLLP